MKKTHTKGVVLIAFGDTMYYGAAYNLAFTIKEYSPNVSITLLTDNKNKALDSHHNMMNVVDEVLEFDSELTFTEGKFDPGKLKVNLYGLLPYTHNLYLDVDAVCLKNIEPLIDEFIESKKPYISHTVGYHTDKTKRDFKFMQWAWADDVWQHWELKDNDVLPAINSSLQFISKSKEAEEIYKVAKDYYENNPLPLEKLRNKWGGGQPDELYMNAAMAKLGYDPAYGETGNNGKSEYGFIHFASVRGLTYEQVTNQYYFQSYYGGVRFTPAFYTEWLDRMLNNMMGEKGLNHDYRIEHIVRRKHANKK